MTRAASAIAPKIANTAISFAPHPGNSAPIPGVRVRLFAIALISIQTKIATATGTA